jgi:hypothetical protein
MRTPIEPCDIRAGDVIRYEPTQPADLAAVEFIAKMDGYGYMPKAFGQHLLLARPKPAVELPTEPALGWLGVTDTGKANLSLSPGRVLGVFKNRETLVDGGPAGSWSHEFVTAFTPATAVPTSALDELRATLHSVKEAGERREDIGDFLAAVDEANR